MKTVTSYSRIIEFRRAAIIPALNPQKPRRRQVDYYDLSLKNVVLSPIVLPQLLGDTRERGR